MKLIEKSLISGLLLTLLLVLTGFANNCENLSTKVLRLHILANSDSAEDQALKLNVRDKIIEKSGNFLSTATSKASAQTLTAKNLDNIREIAEQEVQNRGYTYPVKVQMTKMYFPTRNYGNTTLPAGHYDALRVIIGEGKGKNWWCVIFPQMCLGSAKNSAAIDSVFSNSEKKIINSSGNYEIKFKVVEWFYALKGAISSWLT